MFKKLYTIKKNQIYVKRFKKKNCSTILHFDEVNEFIIDLWVFKSSSY